MIAKKIGRDAVIEEERCDAICNPLSPHRGGEMTLSTIFLPIFGCKGVIATEIGYAGVKVAKFDYSVVA